MKQFVNFLRYVCDHCGGSITDCQNLPEGWVEIVVRKGDGYPHDHERDQAHHFCGEECSVNFARKKAKLAAGLFPK